MMMMKATLLPILSCLTLCAQERPTAPTELVKRAVPDAAKHAYGEHPLQHGELRVPDGRGPHPVAVLVHGGCWSAKIPGLPENVVALELLRPFAEALREQGIAAWSIEYRRLGDAGAGWPNTFLDVGKGVDHLAKLAPANRLDLKRVIVMGHSSGGQLAMWVAARGKLPKSSELYVEKPLRVFGVVSLDGPPELAAARSIERAVCREPVITQLMGGTPEEHSKRYAEASVEAYLPLGIRQELITMSLSEAWVKLATAYEARAKQAGDMVSVIRPDSGGHFGPIDPLAAAGKSALARARALLERE
jgi:acetyl esterase/lipase